MSQYKHRLSFERKLIKKINGWFAESNLNGLSIDSLTKWIALKQFSPDSPGVIKLINISERLKALANRSQEIVDPSIPIELDSLKIEIDELSKDEFK